MLNKFKKIILHGELAREKNQNSKALNILDKAIFESIKQHDYNALLSILGHKLLIYKHAYLKTSNSAYLELMVGQAKIGLQIAKLYKNQVEKEHRAIMLLRISHYYQYKKQYKQALTYIKQATRLLNKKDLTKYAEFLGHYGLVLGMLGNKQGLKTVKQALKILTRAKKVRLFHKLVIYSGLLTRLAILLNKFGKTVEAMEFLKAAEEIAKILAKKYKIPYRLFQIRKLKQDKLQVL